MAFPTSAGPGPPLIAAGVILEQGSVGPHCEVPIAQGRKETFKCSSPPLIRSSSNLKKVTFIPARFRCDSVKDPSPVVHQA